MIKIRLTYVDSDQGRKELERFKKMLDNNTMIINISKKYKGRGNTMYNNIYIDVEVNEEHKSG